MDFEQFSREFQAPLVPADAARLFARGAAR
jgi:hypothetical protein